MIHTADAVRLHVPAMEDHGYNQKPKDNGWKDLKLYQFDGTELYQWRGKPLMRGISTSDSRHYSVFEDQASEVFAIHQS